MFVQACDVVLRVHAAALCRALVPLCRARVALLDAAAKQILRGHCELRIDVVLLGRAQEPSARIFLRALDAGSVLVEQAEVVLRERKALRGRAREPSPRRGGVTSGARPVERHDGDVELADRLSSFGGAQVGGIRGRDVVALIGRVGNLEVRVLGGRRQLRRPLLPGRHRRSRAEVRSMRHARQCERGARYGERERKEQLRERHILCTRWACPGDALAASSHTARTDVACAPPELPRPISCASPSSTTTLPSSL